MKNAKLAAIDQRLTRIMRGPAAIESQWVFRVARPLLAIAKWRASIKAVALTELLALLRSKDKTHEGALAAFAAAVKELEANVEAIERVAIVRKRSPIAHAAWLRRVVGLLELAEEAIDDLATPATKKRSHALRAVNRSDPSSYLPPLMPVPEGATRDELLTHSSSDLENAALVDLELAAIDHLFAAARAETMLLGRRRRLLIAARQRLLEAAAALPLDRDGVRDRTAYLAHEITRIDRLEAAGLDPNVSLVHQARQALTRRDPARLFASISALDANAMSASDREIAQRTGPVLRSMVGRDGGGAEAIKQSFERSAAQILGDVAQDVRAAVDDSRAAAGERLGLGGAPSEHEAAKSFLQYLPADSDTALLRAAVAADGFFEVGGALAAIRVPEEERVLRLVRHPTQQLVLMPAEDVHDLRDAVISDPRTVLLDLATGRLFARRFVREEIRRSTRVVMRGEVRVYVLDGSGSMRGPRARVRDAILIAELSTLIRRLEAPGETRCTLFYRYFDTELGLVSRIDTVKKAHDAIRDVVGNERAGGTDIHVALMASLEQIAMARADDPDLARAQIVLVTDGEAPVIEEEIVRARDALKGLPIGISVIALGQENPVLREIVSRQRAKGEAAFYHYLDDRELVSITEGQLGAADAIHPPARWMDLDPRVLARMLDDEAGDLLNELETIDRERDHSALERLETERQARREVGLVENEPTTDVSDPDPDVDVDRDGDGYGDGERARLEALQKDRVALAARFGRWFPDLSSAQASVASDDAEAAPLPKPNTPERDDLDATCCALASVAEVVTLLAGTETVRQADAIELFERLLPDARLTPARYRSVLHRYPTALAPSMKALREAVAGVPAKPS